MTTPALDPSRLPAELRQRVEGEPGALDALTDAVERAFTEHPLTLDREALAAHLLAHAPDEGPLAAALASLRGGDLLLALACGRGDGAALAEFERRYFDEVGPALARVRTTLTRDEVRQMMRTHLFTATADGAPPRILAFSGRGDLRVWFRVLLVRTLLNVATRGPKERELEDAMMEAIVDSGATPSDSAERRRYGPLLTEALVEAVGRLERRERSLLRLAACDGLTVDAIGGIYGVHRATAARWVAAAKDHLVQEVRDAVRRRVPVGDETLDSILAMADGAVDVSLRAHLQTSSGAALDATAPAPDATLPAGEPKR